MEKLSKETMDMICEAFAERSRILSDSTRTAPTRTMRQLADEEFKKTHIAWEEVETYKRENYK